MAEKQFKTGFVSIIGRPNVGKSTLLNALLKTKVSIVSDKAQTTRDRISGIYNSDKGQIIFLDTPGYHTAKSKMNSFMNNVVFSSAQESDLVLFIVPCDEFIGNNDRIMVEQIKKWNLPTMLVVTKIDKLKKEDVDLKLKEWESTYDGFTKKVLISSIQNINLDTLIEDIYSCLPYSDIQYYPDDMITDKSDRFIIKELIREEILIQTEQEVPHSSAILIDKIEDKNKICKIFSTIYVERKSQKAIIIGKGGDKIKKIGMESRKKIEDFLGRKVYLETFVKVKDDWTRSGSMIKRMGYDIDQY